MSPVSEQIRSLINKANEKNPFYIIGGALALILVIDYFCVMQFQIGTLSSLTPKTKELSQELKVTKNNIARMPQFRAEVNKIHERLSHVNHKIHSKAEVPLILENISKIASANGVKIEQIMPDTSGDEPVLKNQDGQYFAIPIILEAKSGYHHFGRFINQLESEEVFLKFTEFTIAANGNEATQHAIKVTINAIVFEKAG